MKEGYYLFFYSQIDKFYNTAALPARHDQNLAVFLKKKKKIELVCHLELERFSGIKHHDIAFYNREDCCNYLNILLKPYNLTIDSFVEIYGTPGLSIRCEDLSFTSIPDLENISYHAVSHLFSSLLMDTKTFYKDTILALAFDGGSDSVLDKDVESKYLFCGAVSKKGVVDYFPIASPGVYWLYVSDYFKITEGALMALAYATTTKSLETFDDLPDFYKVSDRLQMTTAINKIIERVMSYTSNDENILFINYDNRFTEEECKISIIMKIIQEISIKKIYNQIDSIIDKYHISPENTIIALSGGYALNCPTNTNIMNRYHFKKQQCVPCVNDGGLSIGMGMYFFYKFCDSFEYKFRTAFYGYSDFNNLNGTLEKYSYYIEAIDYKVGEDRAAKDLEREPIIWMDGNAESGPRALGHRSILGNPMKKTHKDLLNLYKQREWWRPVAPIVLEEKISEWFIEDYESPYMLNNFKIKKERAGKVPAILHLDGSARVQTLQQKEDVRLYSLIRNFEKLTGIPMVCNTSLNDKGEPIINTLAQAINFALRKNIKIIYAYGIRISLKNHEQYEKKSCLQRDSEYFFKYKSELKTLLDEKKPYNMSIIDFLIYLYNSPLHKYDLANESDLQKVIKMCEYIKKISLNLQMFQFLEKNLQKDISEEQ